MRVWVRCTVHGTRFTIGRGIRERPSERTHIFTHTIHIFVFIFIFIWYICVTMSVRSCTRAMETASSLTVAQWCNFAVFVCISDTQFAYITHSLCSHAVYHKCSWCKIMCTLTSLRLSGFVSGLKKCVKDTHSNGVLLLLLPLPLLLRLLFQAFYIIV